MNPGHACIECHRTNIDAPQFSVAGTVYMTGHEPDNCNGGSPPNLAAAVVEITDSRGRVTNLTVNAAGNFYSRISSGAVVPPYRAKVKYDGRERAMSAQQTNGDCNSCHTQTGANGAPGRVALP